MKLFTHHKTITDLGLSHLRPNMARTAIAYDLLDRRLLCAKGLSGQSSFVADQLPPGFEGPCFQGDRLKSYISKGDHIERRSIEIDIFTDQSALVIHRWHHEPSHTAHIIPWAFEAPFDTEEDGHAALADAARLVNAFLGAPPLSFERQALPDCFEGRQAYPWFSTSASTKDDSLARIEFAHDIGEAARGWKGSMALRPHVTLYGRTVFANGDLTPMRVKIESEPQADWQAVEDAISRALDRDNSLLPLHLQIIHSGQDPALVHVSPYSETKRRTSHEQFEGIARVLEVIEEVRADME